MYGEKDFANILHSIAIKAFNFAHADSIIIFPYDANHRFSALPIVCGKLLGNITDHGNLAIEGSVRDLVLEKGNIYLRNEIEYSDLLGKMGIEKRDRNLLEQDFWHREKLKSSALLRLELDAESVGVMSINYRSQQEFNPSAKEIIEFIAQFVANGIVNDRLLTENYRFWEAQRGYSLSLSLSEVVTSLAHNSGNLVSAINMQFGRLQLYLRRTADEQFKREKVGSLINRIVELLDALTNDFLRLKEYRRFDELNIQHTDINELVRRTVDLLRSKFERQRIRVQERLSNLPAVSCDQDQVQHVLLNLLLNAAEAMGQNGMLSIKTKLSDDGDSVLIQITDSGEGIPSQFRAKIFEPFFSTKKRAGASGMGLPVSRYIMQSHGGTIEFTSGIKGTTFFIYLPLNN